MDPAAEAIHQKVDHSFSVPMVDYDGGRPEEGYICIVSLCDP